MDEAGTEQEPSSLSGEVVPNGPGEWLTHPAAAALWNIQTKAVYRRIRRGKMLGRKNPETGEPEVWVPRSEEHVPIPAAAPDQEPRSLDVPDQSERLAVALEASIGRALAPLHETIDKQQARIEELVRENERLRIEREHRSRRWEPWERIRRLLGYN